MAHRCMLRCVIVEHGVRLNLRCCGCGTCERPTRDLLVVWDTGGHGLRINQSGWCKYLWVEIGGEGFAGGHWMGILQNIAVICVLHGGSCSIGSIAPGASPCAVVTAGVVLVSAVEKRRICWVAGPYSAVGDQLKVNGCGSGLVIRLCYGDGPNHG
uniref:Uncharacterized protein n=1 Tax=Romanomermis culicivorax TaxID=13658 RepID=A0A915KJ29_ROMCU